MRKHNSRKMAAMRRNHAVKDMVSATHAAKSKNFYHEGEYMETELEAVYKYLPEQRYEKAIRYMQQYFGLEPDSGIPMLCLEDGPEFPFFLLIDVYYIFPHGNPRQHYMVIVRPDSTLFAHGNGVISIVPCIFRIGE